jgi:hypothetical protein
MDVHISCLMFADDLVLVGQTEQKLHSLVTHTLEYFDRHHLQLSVKKSKVMLYNAQTGKMSFKGTTETSPPVLLDQVLSFKYLGIPLSCSPHSLFKSFNANCVKKADNYMRTVLSLVKNGPDRSSLAYTLWTQMAIPAILYGSEIIPLTQASINVIERCQSTVGKFILQIPKNSTNVCANLDAGLQPVWSLIAEKFLGFSIKTMQKSSAYWPKLAMEENLQLGTKSAYTRTLSKYKNSTGTFGLPISQMKKTVRTLATQYVLSERQNYCISTFSMSPPSSKQSWFKMKPWVNDSPLSKIFAEFRSCNTRLGNRGNTIDGRSFKLCTLCEKGDYSINYLIKFQ